MLKVLGFISGSALVFAALIFLLQPDITEQPPERAAPVRLRPATIQPAVPQTDAPDKPAPENESAGDAPISLPPPAPETRLVDLGAPQPATDSEIPATLPVAQTADEPEWHALWDPFHSEFSAMAFAARLERVTGLDYRVVKIDAGKYQVAVAAQTDEELIANLARIEEATGLRLVSNKP